MSHLRPERAAPLRSGDQPSGMVGAVGGAKG